MNPELARYLGQHGAIALHQEPRLFEAVRYARRSGELVSALPGVYVAAEQQSDSWSRMRAVQVRHPDAVLTGASAEFGLGWAPGPVPSITAAVRYCVRNQPGFCFQRRAIDPEWVRTRRGLRLTHPALTTIDLIDGQQGEAIDRSLRMLYADLASMASALDSTPGRRGHGLRRTLLHDSRDEPWSEAERLAHHQLRAAKITGWVTNYPFTGSLGNYYLDIAFPELRLALEIDGWRYHRDRFEDDHRKLADLATSGWTVVPITWLMLSDSALFIGLVRSGLAAASTTDELATRRPRLAERGR